MSSRSFAVLTYCALLVFSFASHAQEADKIGGGFEHDPVGAVPAGWFLPKPSVDAGYALAVTEASAALGKHSAALTGERGDGHAFGNCMRSVDAAPYRGKRVRLSAAVRCEPADEQSVALLWFRVDRPDRQVGFFDNMSDRPIRSRDWQRYEIVGDVNGDAQALALGMLLIGGGTAMFDEVVLEIVDDDLECTGSAQQPSGTPGLAVAAYAAKMIVVRAGEGATLHFPLPLAYRDQTPLTFRLEFESALDAKLALRAGPGPNQVLELELGAIEDRDDICLRYESVVLVGPTSFETLPERVAFPAEWPAEATPWLTATWCCDSDDARFQALGAEIRASTDDVRAVVDAVLTRSQAIFQGAHGRVGNLTAVEALDKQGSCTSCANFVAALFRASGVPARVLAGYPLWSGPLQTHYIVEAYVPYFGWYPVESTMGQASWPNCQQLAVSIVPIEHEAESVAGPRASAAGGVPFLSLTEYGPSSPIDMLGTLKPFCDHEARMLRPLEADAAEWSAAQGWARERWTRWLESKPEIRAGKLEFGPASTAVTAQTLAELRKELH